MIEIDLKKDLSKQTLRFVQDDLTQKFEMEDMIIAINKLYSCLLMDKEDARKIFDRLEMCCQLGLKAEFVDSKQIKEWEKQIPEGNPMYDTRDWIE